MGQGRGVLKASVLLLLGTLLLPPPVSGGTVKGKDVKCYDSHWYKASSFSQDQTCNKTDAGTDEVGCCFFIFSFGEVRTDWRCASAEKGNLDLCEGEDGKCFKYEKDPSYRSVRCVCTAPLCNRPDAWAKDPVFIQWTNHQDNERKGSGAKGEGTTTPITGGESGPGTGGVARTGGKGNMATVAALLVIAALSHRLSSPSYLLLLLTFGATLLLLLPSTVSGEGDYKAVNLTCLSSSKGSYGWGDTHCGADTETCCYYLFREAPTVSSWGCSLLSYCETSTNGEVSRCEERWDGWHESRGLLCHCNKDGCNNAEAWLEDRNFKPWMEREEAKRASSDKTPAGPPSPGGSGASRTKRATVSALLLKAFFILILF